MVSRIKNLPAEGQQRNQMCVSSRSIYFSNHSLPSPFARNEIRDQSSTDSCTFYVTSIFNKDMLMLIATVFGITDVRKVCVTGHAMIK